MKFAIPSNAIVRDNARPEELFCASLFDRYIFLSEELVIGDNHEFGEPDIFTIDKKNGIDIVRSEALKYFVFESFLTECKSVDLDFEKCEKRLEKYDGWGFDVLRSSETGKAIIISNLRKQKDEEFYKALGTNFQHKLEKLNHGFYDGVDKIGLAIMSNLTNKGGSDIKKIVGTYYNIRQNYSRSYDYLFIIFRKHMYMIFEKDGKTRTCHYDLSRSNADFKMYEYKTINKKTKKTSKNNEK